MPRSRLHLEHTAGRKRFLREHCGTAYVCDANFTEQPWPSGPSCSMTLPIVFCPGALPSAHDILPHPLQNLRSPPEMPP
eukprot:3520423-Karenia_brevis.AAC.1